MAKFDETKVINALHTDKAVVGKKYWYSITLLELKREVENNGTAIGKLSGFFEHSAEYPFHLDDENGENDWQFLYPYEEPSKQRMTNRQLVEWLAKGNGEYTSNALVSIYKEYCYNKGEENNEVGSEIKIRTWDSDEWVEPTVDIYERDCKKGKK